MCKARWALAALVLTAVIVLSMIAGKPGEVPVEARTATVQRGDVHQTVAISGRLAYVDEEVILSTVQGIVEDVYVEEGQRVGASEALVRMNAASQEKAISVFVAQGPQMKNWGMPSLNDGQISMEASVVRAEESCTVRQVYVEERSMVSVGMPIARVSSHEQEIVCSVSPVDAARISEGMWAWISTEGEVQGQAVVQSVGEKKMDVVTGYEIQPVRLRAEQHLDLSEGAVIDVNVFLAGSDDVMCLPVEAITERETVWWVNDGRCTEIPAQIVLADEMLAWVNLPEGIQVAIGEFQEGQFVVEADE